MVGWSHFRGGTVLVWRSSTWQGVTDQVAVSADHCDVDSRYRQHVTGFGDDMAIIAFGQDLLVCLSYLYCRRIGCLAIGTVIDESFDWDFGHQLGYAPGVIYMVVGQQYVIDVVKAGQLHCGSDAGCVAALVAGPHGIDKERVLVGGNEQSRLAAFYVNEVDLEGGARRLRECDSNPEYGDGG